VRNAFASRVTAAAVVICVGVLAPAAAQAQLPTDPVERARVIAELRQINARQLTILDRQGRAVATVGSRDMYFDPVLSPDARRVAVVRADIDKETNDLGVVDVATGTFVPLTSSQPRERAAFPAWSPDGNQIAYVGLRRGRFSIYRKSADGTGTEELVYESNTPVALSGWSADARHLTYVFSDLKGGAIYVLPLDGGRDRKPIEVFRSTSQLANPRLSPDNRFIAYVSNESGRNEVYVRRFDAVNPTAAAAEPARRISDQGTRGIAAWRRDGQELYYVAGNQALMAVAVARDSADPFGKPRQLFRVSEENPIFPGVLSIASDGTRFVVAAPPSQLRRLTVFDRSGKIVRRVQEPGIYVQPGMSPDGTRAVVMKTDPETGNQDIWTINLASGKGVAITSDTPPENAPVWSADGKYVLYASTRGEYSEVYRRAADGSAPAELLFRNTPGAFTVLTDVSPDGRFLTFSIGALMVVPLDPSTPPAERKAIEWLREEYDVAQGRFSPDGRYLAFLSNEADGERMDVYVRPFDATKPQAPAGPGVRVSTTGALGMIVWRQDGRELYYLTRRWDVMAVEITTSPTFTAGTPRRLFTAPGPLVGNPQQWKSVGRDGQQFMFALPADTSSSSR
jgi:eukaryotic-like serine/threonine-protein kinase